MADELKDRWWGRRAAIRPGALTALAALLMLGGCAPGSASASDESKFLQATTIPQILAWANGSDDRLELARLISEQGFEWICVVPEYTSITSIEDSTGPIETYRGASGYQVPETHLAIIGVRKSMAHVAYMNYQPLSLYAENSKCKSANKAVIIRIEGHLPYSEEAMLEEVDRR